MQPKKKKRRGRKKKNPNIDNNDNNNINKPKSSRKRRFICKGCGKNYAYEGCYNRHVDTCIVITDKSKNNTNINDNEDNDKHNKDNATNSNIFDMNKLDTESDKSLSPMDGFDTECNQESGTESNQKDELYTCNICKQSGNIIWHLNHARKHAKRIYKCHVIGCTYYKKGFKRKDTLQKHIENVHEKKKIKCFCGKMFCVNTYYHHLKQPQNKACDDWDTEHRTKRRRTQKKRNY